MGESVVYYNLQQLELLQITVVKVSHHLDLLKCITQNEIAANN